MKKLLVSFTLCFAVFSVHAMCDCTEDSPMVSQWKRMQQWVGGALLQLGMSEEDLKLNCELSREVQLTKFWAGKKEASQEEKDRLLSQIVNFGYTHPQDLGLGGHDSRMGSTNLGLKLQLWHIASAVKIGANPNVNEACSNDSLLSAYRNKNTKIARLLIRRGADPERLRGIHDDALSWCQQIQEQMEEETCLKYIAAKAALKHYKIDGIKKLSFELPADLLKYLEKTQKGL